MNYANDLIGAGATHFVPVIWPASSGADTAINSDRVNVGKANGVLFLVQLGAIDSGFSGTIVVYGADAATGGNSTALATLRYRIMKTVDTWTAEAVDANGALTIVAGGDIVPVTDNNCMVALRVLSTDIAALGAGYKFAYVTISAGGSSKAVIASAVAGMIWPRYCAEPPVSVIA